MALIKCPGCGHKVSDKAAKCLHCDQVINQEMYNKNLQVVRPGSFAGMICAAAAAAALIVVVVLKITGVI